MTAEDFASCWIVGGHRPPPGVWTLFRCLVRVNPNLRLELCTSSTTHWRILNVSIVMESVVPSWDRRGGCASRKYREAPLIAQTGWSVQNDHPVRAFQRMPSAIFLDGTATPPVPGPVPGGDYPPLYSLSVTHGKCPNSRRRSMTVDSPCFQHRRRS